MNYQSPDNPTQTDRAWLGPAATALIGFLAIVGVLILHAAGALQ